MARSDGARVLGRVMPFWYVGSVVFGAAWVALGWGQPGVLAVLAATVLLVVGVLTSVVLLVPINSRVARWSSGEVPPDWCRQVGRWDRFHHVRVCVIGTAFVLFTLSLA